MSDCENKGKARMMRLCHVELRSAAFTVTVCLNISEGPQCRLTGSAQSSAVAARGSRLRRCLNFCSDVSTCCLWNTVERWRLPPRHAEYLDLDKVMYAYREGELSAAEQMKHPFLIFFGWTLAIVALTHGFRRKGKKKQFQTQSEQERIRETQIHWVKLKRFYVAPLPSLMFD